jgi:hypothetical protein
MAVLSGTANDQRDNARPAPFVPAPGWFQRFNDGLDRMALAAFNALMGWLCRASRGYLCPPDMPSIMYPEDRTSDASSAPTFVVADERRCCDEKLSGK